MKIQFPTRVPWGAATILGWTVLGGFLLQATQAQDLVINEVMSSNSTTILDEDGESSDWVEIKNNGSSAIQLKGYGLSDDANPLKWVFPGGVVPPGGHSIVFCSGKDRSTAPAYWETVVTEGDTWRYIVPTSEPSDAWRGPDFNFNDSAWSRGATGIGYGDGDDRTVVPEGTVSVYARAVFVLDYPDKILDVVLDIDFDDGFVAFLNGVEIARENLTDFGRPPAFSEVANTFTEPRLLTGAPLRRYREERFRTLLRAGKNVLAIQVHNAGSSSSDLSLLPFLTLGMNETDEIPWYPRGPAERLKRTFESLHTNFKISSAGEGITLASPDGTVLDSVQTGWLPTDFSIGRFPDGGGAFSFHALATPGAPNASAGHAAIGSPVTFSHTGGLHPDPVTLALSKPDPAGTIFFTTDGSVPTEASTRYTTPLQLSATTVVRARVLGAGVYPGKTMTHTLIIGQTSTLPFVSISTDPANFFDNEIGIYVHGTSYDSSFPYFGSNFWEDWERPVHLELFEPGGALGFSVDAGTKIFGGYSRGNPQRSLAFFARSEYGASEIRYRMFPGKDIDKFESFVLRNSGNDWQITHFRDAMMTSLLDGLNVDRQAYRPAAVLINGEYWGILNLREKVNEHFIAANHKDVKKDQVDLLEGSGSAIHGDTDHYRALITLLEGSDVSDPAVYARVEAMVDLENFMDYQAAQIYFDNTDWPGNNIKFWRPRIEGGRWRWIIFDTDFGFGIWNESNYTNNTLAFALEPNGPGWPNPPWSTLMLRKLATNRRFVEDFANRFATHLNTIFAPPRVVARIDAMARVIEPEMPAQRSRWGSDVNAWRSSVQVLRSFANRRVPYVQDDLESILDLGGLTQLRINLTSPVGGVVAIQGIPIRQYPFAGSYFEGLPIRLTARPDPGYRFAGWTGIEPVARAEASVLVPRSGLTVSAAFELDCAAAGNVVLNEIQYNAPVDADPGDWVELYNRTSVGLNLGGWTIRDASERHLFTFPTDTWIDSGGYLVLCSDVAAFVSLHPTVQSPLGNLGFSLSGGGESIELLDASGLQVDSVAFGDSAPWPEEADGKGATLALKNPSLENSQATHWSASPAGGTPGSRNDVYETLDTDCNEVAAPILRGDCDADGTITIVDPVRLLLANFSHATVPCRSACDANGDGKTGSVSDSIYLLRYLFLSGPRPVSPFPGCGAQTLSTDSELGCAAPPTFCRQP